MGKKDEVFEVFTLKELVKAIDDNPKRPVRIRSKVRVPLRECDYDPPMRAKLKPYKADSKVDVLSLSLAARLCLHEPECRKFKHWPDQVIPAYVFEIIRRRLLKAGFSEHGFENLTIADVAELLGKQPPKAFKKLERRGKGKLEKTVKALLANGESESTAIAKIINERDEGLYEPTSAESVRKTAAWKNRDQKKS